VAAASGDNRTQTGVLCAGCEKEGESERETGAGDDGWWLTAMMAGRVPAMQIEQASSGSYGGRGAEPGISQTRNLARIQPKSGPLALITGPLAWIEVGGL